MVEKTSSRRTERFASSSSLGEEDERAERETIGSEEKEVDIVADVGGQEGGGGGCEKYGDEER